MIVSVRIYYRGLFLLPFSGLLYLNGAFPALLVQFLTLGGMLFSLATLGDCSFASTGKRLFLPDYFGFDGLPEGFDGFNKFGFIFFAKPNGECYWYDYGVDPNGQVDWYIRVFTPEWNVARGFAVVGFVGGLVMFFYSLSLTCSAQVQGMRFFAGFFLCVPLSCFQALTFLAFSSDFCQEVECDFSRSSTFSTVSACMYFCSGLLFIFMTNYPGDSMLAEEKERLEKIHQTQSVVSPTALSPEATPTIIAPVPEEPAQDAVDPEIVEVDVEIIGEETAPTEKQPEETTANEAMCDMASDDEVKQAAGP